MMLTMPTMPTTGTTPTRPSPPTATVTATATPTGTGSRSKTAYATHLVRMSRALRTMAEKTDAPVVERIHDLREEVKAMLAASAAHANEDESTLSPGASTSTSHGRSGSEYAAKLKTHVVALAFESSLAGAKHQQNVRSLSEELERAAQWIVQSEAHSAMLAKRLDARGREVMALRRALARVQQESAAAATSPGPSETVNTAVPASTQVTEDTSTANDVQDDKDDKEDAVDYKRQCAVLRAHLEGQRKTHARALSQALQRTMAMETLLTQARAAMADAASSSSTTTVDGDEDDVEDDSADENVTHATISSTSLATASATTMKTFDQAAVPSAVPRTSGESTPTSDSESPAQESSPGAVDVADPVVCIATQERGDGAIAESPTSAVPPQTQGPRPSRIPPPTIRIPPSLMRTSLQTRLPVTSASGSTRGLRWPGWTLARGAAVANATAANATAPRAPPAASPTVAAARTTTAAPAMKSSTVRMAMAVKHPKKKAQQSAPKPKTSATKAALEPSRHWR